MTQEVEEEKEYCWMMISDMYLNQKILLDEVLKIESQQYQKRSIHRMRVEVDSIYEVCYERKE